MTDLIRHRESSALPLPVPRLEVNIRLAVPDDVEAIDALQKPMTKAVGFLHFGAIKGYIEKGDVLIAEAATDHRRDACATVTSSPPHPLTPSSLAGYIIGRDSYYRNQTCGYITQLNVHPDYRRHLVGAKLVEALFERAAYGCKLYSCWCAQDLPANYFWESIGFVPIAFRTGSEQKERIHIFWQKRIRTGDTETEYWYPNKTSGGQIGEDRIAVPIPPGTHWSDAKPTILPGLNGVPMYKEPTALPAGLEEEIKALSKREKKPPAKEKEKSAKRPKNLISRGGLRSPTAAEVAAKQAAAQRQKQDAEREEKLKEARKAKRKRQKRKYSDEFIAAAREFRDRFIESAHQPGNEGLIALPKGKYEVSRAIEGPAGLEGMLGTDALSGDEASTPMLTGETPEPLTGDVEHHEDDDIIDAAFTVIEDRDNEDQADEMRDAA